MDLTILIISYKSLPKLDRCISHLGNSHKVIVIENSNNYTIKKNIENLHVQEDLIQAVGNICLFMFCMSCHVMSCHTK